MKKNLFFSMIVMLLCSIQVSAYTFYFHPYTWAATYDKYAVQSWGEDYEASVYSEFMTPVEGHDGWFSSSVPDGNSNLCVCAYNSDATDPATGAVDWSWQIGDGGTYTYFYNNIGYMEDFDGKLTDGRILSGNILYTVNDEDHTAAVAYDQSPVNPTGEIVIPSSFTWKTTTYTVTSIASSAYWYGGEITAVSLPNTLTHIGDAAFIATGLTSVTIPRSVTSIEDGAFALCGNLSSVTLEEGLTALGTQMFQGDPSLTEITIPNSITDLPAGILSSCENLVSVTLGTGVDTIGENAFSNSDKLARLAIYAPAPPTVNDYNHPALVSTCCLMVPSSVKAAYEAHPYWSQFEIKGIYIVTFKDKDGKTIAAVPVEQGQDAVAPEAPELECFTFTGWDKAFTNITADLTVNALYSQIEYTVTFLNDGVQFDQQHVNCGEDAIKPATDPTKEGHHFTGWDADFTDVHANLTVNALFEINTYTVTFKDSEGNIIGQPQVVEWNKAATAPDAPEVECRHFTGWDKAFDHVTADLIVTAQYALNQFEVTFVDRDGTELDKQTVDCGSAATAPDAPHHTGYTFVGWDQDFNEVTADLVVTAQFTPGEEAELNVQFIHESDVLTERMTTFMIPAAPAIEGFKFIGWRPVAQIIEDVIQIEAVYEKDSGTAAPAVYTNPDNTAQKLVRDGNVYILKDGREYTITGLKVK